MKQKANNEFDPFLNECQTYVWEWYIPEHIVRFGIPSLNSLWVSSFDNNIKLSTMLERVHPDDIEKIFVRQSSPIYKSDKMFEVDLRINVADELTPGGKSSGQYEWFGFRGKIIRRDEKGKPTYLRGVAINIDHRVKVQSKLISNKERHLQNQRQHTEYCLGVMQEFSTFLSNMASHADSIITGETSGTREERLMQVNLIKEQGAHLLELIDRARQIAGTPVLNQEQGIQHVALWEHLAELQQVYSLRITNGMKVYFSNLYDNISIDVNVKLLDLLLENVVNCQIRNTRKGYITLNYQLLTPQTIQFCVSCTESEAHFGNLEMVLTEDGMSLSLCRILAKRLMGEVEVRQSEDRRLHYLITLPVDARRLIGQAGITGGVNDDEEEDFDEDLSELAGGDENNFENLRASVLIGSTSAVDLFQNQHLFHVSVASNTDDVWRMYEQNDPDIVFVDYNLPGTAQIDETIARMHQLHPDTPILVTAQYATRPLHHRIRQDGARYLMSNPLSLRKINMMIKKYLK